MNEYRRPKLSMPWYIRWQRLRGRWTFLVWLALAGVAALLYREHAGFTGMMGAVETVAEDAAPIEVARLLSIEVVPGQRVKKGDVLARFDTSLIDAEAAVAEAELKQEQNTTAGYQDNILQMRRQFDMEVHGIELDLDTLRMQQERETAELEALRVEQKRREELRAKNLMNDTDASELRPQIAGLERGVAGYPGLVKCQEARLAAARTNRDTLLASLNEPGVDAGDALRERRSARVRVLEASRKHFEMLKSWYVLRASQDGIVSEVDGVPGNVIQAGQPLIRLVSEAVDQVWGFVPEAHGNIVRPGTPMHVWRPSGGDPVDAVVETIAPEVQALPTRISPIQTVPLRGRRVTVRLTGRHDFLPGETVRVAPVRAPRGRTAAGTEAK